MGDRSLPTSTYNVSSHPGKHRLVHYSAFIICLPSTRHTCIPGSSPSWRLPRGPRIPPSFQSIQISKALTVEANTQAIDVHTGTHSRGNAPGHDH